MMMRNRQAISAAAFETLEDRRLFAGYPLVTRSLPFQLDFNVNASGVGIRDKDGQNTGLTWVQPNNNGTEYDPSKIDLDTGNGVLKITSSGNASTGSNSGTPNTQVNVLQTQFDGSTGAFKITTRIKGPLNNLSVPFAQAGLVFGADADNFVKLVAVATSGGQVVQFLDEQTKGGNIVRTLGTDGMTANPGAFSSFNTLDLTLNCDPNTNTISAFYGINGNATQTLLGNLTISFDKAAAFFSATSNAGVQVLHKNSSGAPTVSFDQFKIESITGGTTSRPSIDSVQPANGSTGQFRNIDVVAYPKLPNGGIAPNTITTSTVRLYATATGVEVAGSTNTSGGGDSIVFHHDELLASNTNYTFQVTSGLRDESGAAFTPFTSTFTTGTGTGENPGTISFSKTTLSVAQGKQYTGLTIGPDNKLYATSLDGNIYRFAIGNDGTLGAQQTIGTIRNFNGGDRFITGLVFDPKSTAADLTVYVTHTAPSEIDDKVSTNFDGPDWTGKVTRLSGANLETYADYVVGLPRSVKDHITNQPVIGPDGNLYFAQGASNAKGEPDATWKFRAEHLLTGAVIQVDLAALKARRAAGQGAINVRTEYSDGTTPYNPFLANSPVTIYASGIRNAYSMVFASNGHLYASGNSSAAGGNTPQSAKYSANFGNRIDKATAGAYTGPAVPGLTSTSSNQLPAIDDFLYDVKPGKYYGQPNPTRAEFVLNGGNPTSGKDPYEQTKYPVGTLPDRNWVAPAYDFGLSYSPDGIIEYKSNAFNGALKGKLLVTRWSRGDDIVALSVNADGTINPSNVISGSPGLTGFTDPLDVVEDTRNGNLYVAEFERNADGIHRITLLKPNAPVVTPPVDPPTEPTPPGNSGSASITSQRLYNDPAGGVASPSQAAILKASSKAAITINSYALSGANANLFQSLSNVAAGTVVAKNGNQRFSIVFNPPSGTAKGLKTAIFTVNTSAGSFTTNLRAISTTGTGDDNEPSLQAVLDLHQLKINVGDNDSTTTAFPVPPGANDEITAQQFVKAGTGQVTFEALGAFAVAQSPSVRIGYYDPGTPQDTTELFQVSKADAQWVNPALNGNNSFDPGSKKFALYGEFPLFLSNAGDNRKVYQEDVLNQWETNASRRRKMRVYPLKNANGAVEANAYVVAFEEFNLAFDQNDFVGIIRNVKPVSGSEWGVENVIGFPDWNRMVFNYIPPDGYNATYPNKVRDTETLRVFNTGSNNLSITANIASGPFSVSGSPKTIAPYSYGDLTVKFTATGGSLSTGSLVINSDNANEPSKTINLAGIWQRYSEFSPSDPSNKSLEPTLSKIIEAFGYSTTILKSGQTLDTQGQAKAVGDEIISPYWQATHSTVEVIQLAAYHNQGFTPNVAWYAQGKPDTLNSVTTAALAYGQSMLPAKLNGNTNFTTTGTFRPTGSFGMRFDVAYTDDAVNKSKYSQLGTKGGHLVRAFPLRDAEGNLVPNTYIIGADNLLTLPDYQDNVYLIRGIKPVNSPAVPESAGGVRTTAGLQLSWAPNREAVSGYNIYRSDTGSGAFTKLNATGIITVTTWLDAAAIGTHYYRLTAVDSAGNESGFESFTTTV